MDEELEQTICPEAETEPDAVPAEPAKKRKKKHLRSPEEQAMRRSFSRCGWAIVAGFGAQTVITTLAVYITAIVILLQNISMGAAPDLSTLLSAASETIYAHLDTILYVLVPAYYAGDLAAFLLVKLILRRCPKLSPAKRRLNAHGFFLLAGAAIGLWGLGVLFGNLPSFYGVYPESGLDFESLGWDAWPYWVMTVTAAPLFEELIFRKCLIDAMEPYGERSAVVVSALLFALVHQNSAQFFLALGAGLAFGLTYVRTGRLRYTMVMHFAINFFSVLGSLADLAGGGWPLLWTLLLFAAVIVGTVCLIRNRKNPFFFPARNTQPYANRAMFRNAGMIAAVVIPIGEILLYALSDTLLALLSDGSSDAAVNWQMGLLSLAVTGFIMMMTGTAAQLKGAAASHPGEAESPEAQ